MADSGQTGRVTEMEFCSELLSPSDLFAARSRSHKIPVRGQKDFLPDGSDQQRERLQHSLDEHWNLIAEERVERLGNLVKAKWIPSKGLVELQSPAGKFWQTMGFSEHGKQVLFPEEALYLMECGNAQVFYHDLPLSIQEGYERFLAQGTVSLHQYQVFAHLKRLGYVVTRFEPRSVYAQQLNLPQSRDRQERNLKRKRSHSPASGEADRQEEQAGEEMVLEQVGDVEDQRPRDSSSNVDPVAQCTREDERPVAEGPAETESTADSAPQRSWWVEQASDPEVRQPGRSGPRWDFSAISFPDLGCRGRPPSLAAPDPSLLPGTLSVGSCDVAPWLRKLNLREERMSRRERERERARFRRGVNEDREVRRCRNWAEYHQLLERRSRHSRRDRPAHLWEGAVVPLLQPGQYTSPGDLLNKISVIQPSRLLEGASRLGQGSEEWRISFNVYQPDTVADFKKSNPGKPYSRIFEGPVPDLRALKQLSLQSGDVPVTFAVVDHGDISFYSFKDFQLPTDVSH
ncbi:tRNA-splicing endonuclease subunit Sen54 isoform X2 [Megalops cyprinoides]|uniref:tRNA-splicing endonuclease subunit Sen54 isoform X2 n=1 Tax=Megalops cyprinoides TaxID=118141 RepID=UPI00186414EA|nr:tRNA-splicing endonuclease subunit Sen54 isoform X2 [Megalops cyprinoides]